MEENKARSRYQPNKPLKFQLIEHDRHMEIRRWSEDYRPKSDYEAHDQLTIRKEDWDDFLDTLERGPTAYMA